MKAIGKALGRVRSSRIYHKLFVAKIDYQQVEDRKVEMLLKYQNRGWF